MSKIEILTRPLTTRQRDVLEFIEAHCERQGTAPTLREIGDALGMSSLATVHSHLDRLRRKGYVNRLYQRQRSTVASDACPMCGKAR